LARGQGGGGGTIESEAQLFCPHFHRSQGGKKRGGTCTVVDYRCMGLLPQARKEGSSRKSQESDWLIEKRREYKMALLFDKRKKKGRLYGPLKHWVSLFGGGGRPGTKR